MLDLREVPQLLNRRALAQGLIHDELALARRVREQGKQLVLCLVVEILRPAQTVTAVLQTADRLLEGFLIGLADAHDLTDGAHLRAQLVLGSLELLKGPARELNHNVVAARNVLVQRAVLAAGDLVERQPAGKHRGNQGDREAGSLGGESGGTGGAGVDLDNDDAAALGIVGKLHVGAADHADLLHDLIRLPLQLLLHVLADGEHRGGAEGIAGVHTEGIDILDEADGDHVILRVAHDLELKLLPAEDGFLDQNLADEAGLQTARADGAQLVHIIDKAAACAAHRVGGTQHHGISQLFRDGEGVVDGIGHFAAGHLDPQLVHGVLELDAVLAALDGIDIDADHLHIVFLEDAGLVQLRAQVQAGLSAEVRQQSVGTLLCDDLLQTLHIQGLDVGDVRRLGVGHDGGRIRVDEHNLISELPQGLACLRAGVVKLAGLADDDGTGADDQDLVNIISLHKYPSPRLSFVSLYPY